MGARAPRRRRGWGVLAVAALLLLLAAAPTLWTRIVSAGRTYDVASAPETPVALVFGASVYASGDPSPYLEARLRTAQELFDAGKVRAILVSGDNGSKYYDEPTAMRTWLLSHGVPERRVVADFAGFDTHATCVRAKEVFGAHEVVVVTQTYHLYRALATCRAVGLDAIGVGDETVRSYGETWSRGVVREVAATWKMTWDLVSDRQPVLGPRETSLDEALR